MLSERRKATHIGTDIPLQVLRSTLHTMHSLELFAGNRRIVGEGLVEEDDDGGEDREEEAESQDDGVPDPHGEGGVSAEVGLLALELG